MSMFDCIGAICTYLHVALLTSGPFWVRKLKDFLENFLVLGLNRFRMLVKISQKVELEL